MSEKYNYIERQGQNAKIDQLSAVVRPRAGRDRSLFIGWTKEGVPQITDSEIDLAVNAKNSYQINQKARLPLRTIPYSHIEPVNYLTTGQPIDLMDQDGVIAGDLLTYTVMDKDGNTQTLTLGELNILNSLVDSHIEWQDLGNTDKTDVIVSTKSMHTLFVEPEEGSTGEAFAILFKPAFDGESNEIAFKAFVRKSLSKLLVLDESQEPHNRKGYIDAAAQFTKGNGRSTLASIVSLFYDKGEKPFINTSGAKVGILKLARSLGIYNISDVELEEMSHPLPFYDVEEMDMETLFNVVNAMREAANEALSTR